MKVCPIDKFGGTLALMRIMTVVNYNTLKMKNIHFYEIFIVILKREEVEKVGNDLFLKKK